MSLRIIYQATSIVTTTLFFIFLTLPLTLLNGSTFFLDTTLRVSPSTPYLETYSFWWTALTYLSPFFYLILLILFHWYARRNCLLTLHSFFILFLLYLFESIDYLPLNFNEISTSYAEYGLNVLLTNALNKYHPFIFYLSTGLLLVSFIFFVTLWFDITQFSLKQHLNLVYSLGWQTICFNLIALFMGSWWALQEGTWGGWWNWDSSETLGLEVSLVTLLLLHTVYPIRGLADVSIRSWILVFGFISTYFFIQLNFELVSHNFGSKFFFFFNNNLFSLEVIFTTLVVTLALIHFSWQSSIRTISYKFKTSSITYTTPPFRNLIPKLIPYVVVTFWILWSYRPLCNYFIWNFLGINIFNSEHSLQSTHTILALVFLIWLARDCSRILLLVWFITPIISNWVWVLTLLTPTRFLNTQLHSLLLVLSLLNLTLSEVASSFWFPQSAYTSLLSSPFTLWMGTESLTVDAYSCEVVLLQGPLNESSHLSWNLVTLSNITNINFFILDISHSTCTNHYNLGFSYVTTYLKLELPSISILVLIFWLAIWVVIFIHKRYLYSHF